MTFVSYALRGLVIESCQGQEVILFSRASIGTSEPSSLLISDFRASFSGVKQLGLEFDHSTPSSAEVRNKWI